MSKYKVDAHELIKSTYNLDLPQIIDSTEHSSPIDWLTTIGLTRSDVLDFIQLGLITIKYYLE